MTEKHLNCRASGKLPSLSGTFFGAMSIFALVLLIKNAESAVEYMKTALILCANTVIPSLFPFMVVSDILTSSGIGAFLGRAIARPMRRIFGLGSEAGSVLLLGAFCGFPIGAKCAVSLYDSGRLSASECEKLLTFSNNPSSAFMISAVGISLFGSRRQGLLLYALTLVSSLAVGIVFCRLIKEKEEAQSSHKKENSPPRHALRFGADEFTNAITSSAFGVIRVCAFVVFFSVFLGTLGDLFESLGVTRTVRALFFCFFELTGGMTEATRLVDTKSALILAAFAAGWSGLSVHFQIMSICSGRGLSFKPYFAAKLAQGLICALFTSVCVGLFPQLTDSSAQSGFYPEGAQTLSLCPAFVIFCAVLAGAIAIKLPLWYNRIIKKRS